jgi:hypothetical protein
VPIVGREVLRPAAGTQVLARFADGSAAMTMRSYGKGRAYVAGFYPGLEYSATIRDGTPDMSRDLDPARRSFITIPALSVTRPVVEASSPLVEGVLLRHPEGGRRAAVLMNWGYRLDGLNEQGRPRSRLVELEDVRLTIRGAGEVARVRSVMLEQDLPLQREGDAVHLAVPRLAEADVLVLE